MTGSPSAVVLTVGNEIVSGDVENTNASWLARRLGELGLEVTLLAAVRDAVDEIAGFLRAEAERVDAVIVTGGLGGTPDDMTREAVAAAFGVTQVEQPAVAAALRARFTRDPDYAARWALLPEGSRPLENPLGGAPGFVLRNVYVLPGLPSEMRAMFDAFAEELRGGAPIATWRHRYRARESELAAALAEAGERWPEVLVGSYPSFGEGGPTVEIVLKSTDADDLAAAAAWVESAVAATLPASG
jgi:nicotinamide-nucleotide amidase